MPGKYQNGKLGLFIHVENLTTLLKSYFLNRMLRHRGEFRHGMKDDERIRSNKMSSESFLSCLVVLLNSMCGLGIAQNYHCFACGFLFVTIVNIACALLAYYYSWMMIYLMRATREVSFESIWIGCGFKAFFVICIGMLVPCVGFISVYLTQISSLLKLLYQQVWEGAPVQLTDSLIVGLILSCTVFFPLYLRNDLRYIVILSYIGMIPLLGLLVLFVWWAVDSIRKRGFDPDHKVTLFNFQENWMTAVAEYVSTYVMYLTFSLILSHLRDLTYKRALRLMRIGIAVLCVYLEIMGIFGYLTSYSSESLPLMAVLDQTRVSVVTGIVFLIVKLITMVPTLVDPLRLSMLKIVVIHDTYPATIWGYMGVLLLVIASVFSLMNGAYLDIWRCILNVMVMFMQYISPAALLITKRSGLKRGHWIGIVLFIILGLAFSIFSLYDISSYV